MVSSAGSDLVRRAMSELGLHAERLLTVQGDQIIAFVYPCAVIRPLKFNMESHKEAKDQLARLYTVVKPIADLLG